MCSFEFGSQSVVFKRCYVGSTKRSQRRYWVGCCDHEARERMSLEDYELFKMFSNRYWRVAD